MFHNMTTEGNSTITPDSSQHDISVLSIVEYTLFALIFFTSALGNSLLCAVVYHRRSMRTTRNYLIVNLAITDLTVVLICIPVDIMVKAHDGGWPLGPVMCKITYPLMTLLTTNSVGTLVSISGDRYRAIVHPWKPRLSLLQTKVMILCIWMISLVSIIPYVMVLQQIGNSCEEVWPESSNNFHRKLYTATLFMLQYVIPLIIIAAAYTSIGIKLHNQQPVSDTLSSGQMIRPVSEERSVYRGNDDTSYHEHFESPAMTPKINGHLKYQTNSPNLGIEVAHSDNNPSNKLECNGNNHPETKNTVVKFKPNSSFINVFKKTRGNIPQVNCTMAPDQCSTSTKASTWRRNEDNVRRHRQKAKVIKMLVAVVLVYALCLLPHQVIWMYYDFGEPSNTPALEQILVFTSLLVYLNTAINPFLYAGMNQEFRKGFTSLLSCIFHKGA